MQKRARGVQAHAAPLIDQEVAAAFVVTAVEVVGRRNAGFDRMDAGETLALPMFPELTSDQQHYVVETVRRFFHGNS